jgi:hypothetical protein
MHNTPTPHTQSAVTHARVVCQEPPFHCSTRPPAASHACIVRRLAPTLGHVLCSLFRRSRFDTHGDTHMHAFSAAQAHLTCRNTHTHTHTIHHGMHCAGRSVQALSARNTHAPRAALSTQQHAAACVRCARRRTAPVHPPPPHTHARAHTAHSMSRPAPAPPSHTRPCTCDTAP